MTDSPSRRAVLASVGGALAAGLAGCSSVTSQEFAASPVRLPEGVREELGLAERFADAQTTTRDRTVGGQDVEVTITNQFAGYGRAQYPGSAWSASRPTLVERFAGAGRESTPGAGNVWSPSINVVASEVGIEGFDPEFVEGDTPVDASEVTLVVPEWTRSGGELQHGKLMALHHAEALGVDELTSRGGANYLVDVTKVIPNAAFAPTAKPDVGPDARDERWVAGHEGHWIPDDPTRLQCLVCLGERSPADVFGVDEIPGLPLEEGETVTTENTLLFAPAPKEAPAPDNWSPDPTELFDAGYPTPMGGPSYGLGIIATPNAEISGKSVNPLARTSPEQFLTSDVARGALADAGLTDADEVEWLRGPAEQAPVWTPDDTVSVLGEETAVEISGGIVSGRNGPWAVAVHLAKATPDDVVVPVAIHRRPVGTPDGRPLYDEGSEGGFIDRRWTARALEFTVPVVASLEAGPGDA